MKICHCIKAEPCELAALQMTLDILGTIEDDDLLSNEFYRQTGIEICNIHSRLDDVISFIKNFGE